MLAGCSHTFRLALQVTRPRAMDELMDWADLILVEFPWQFSYVYKRAAGKPMVYCSHNVEKHKFQSYGAALGITGPSRWLRYVERLERQAVLDADLIVAVSDADQYAFVSPMEFQRTKIAVVENGSDTERFVPVSSRGSVNSQEGAWSTGSAAGNLCRRVRCAAPSRRASMGERAGRHDAGFHVCRCGRRLGQVSWRA